MLGQQVIIEAPDATAAAPLQLTFELDASVMAAKGVSYTDIAVFRNGQLVPDCTTSDGTATPDPCLASRQLQADGDAVFTVLSSHASTWDMGVADSIPPTLNAASLSPATIIAGQTTSLSAGASADATRAEFFIGADPGVGLANALNGSAGSFSSPPFGATLAAGTYTVNVRVADDADNWSPLGSLTLTVLPVPTFSGFFGIKNPPAENSVKPGSNVSMVFSLGRSYGLDVFVNGTPKIRAYACGTTPSGTYSSLPSSDWKLKYDPSTDRYNLAWKTAKGTSGCREVLLQFYGGAQAAARFSFK